MGLGLGLGPTLWKSVVLGLSSDAAAVGPCTGALAAALDAAAFLVDSR